MLIIKRNHFRTPGLQISSLKLPVLARNICELHLNQATGWNTEISPPSFHQIKHVGFPNRTFYNPFCVCVVGVAGNYNTIVMAEI